MCVIMVLLISNEPTLIGRKGTLRDRNNGDDNMSDDIRQNPLRLCCQRG